MNKMSTKKIVFLGPSISGKTITSRRWRNYDDTRYTFGVEVHPVIYNGAKYNIWDCAGRAVFQGLREGYCIGADGAIIFSDGSNIDTYLETTRDIGKVIIVDTRQSLPNISILDQFL